MLYAWRGIGKTFFALEIAYAVASGGSFLGWTAPKPRGVLYVDGEMPGTVLQERIARIVSSSEQEAAPGTFRIITPDMQEAGMPNLSEQAGQQEIGRHIDETTELVIVNNLSCLVRGGGRENDAESWLSVQDWALRLRSRGKSVLFVHHAGKGGAQRGTSKRENVLDVVLLLRRPANYDRPKVAMSRFTMRRPGDSRGRTWNPSRPGLSRNRMVPGDGRGTSPRTSCRRSSRSLSSLEWIERTSSGN